MAYRLCILFFVLFNACIKQNKTAQHIPTKQTEAQLDSIFEAFEETAYLNAASYVHNPDSLFNGLPADPQTDYQKEMYSYGLLFMGYSLLTYGDNFQSIKYYEKAYDYIRSSRIQIANINIEIIKPLANLYVRINDTEKSIALLQNAILETKDPKEVIGLTNNLANAYLYNSEFKKAKSLLLNIIEEPSTPLLKALLYNTLASVYEEEQDKENSKKYNTLAVKRFQESKVQQDTLLWYIGALGLQGELQGKTLPVVKALSLAEEHYPNTQNRFKAKLSLIKAEIYRQQNQPTQALAAYDKALSLFATKGYTYKLDYTFTQALVGKARVASKEKKIDSALYYYQWAIENDFRTQQLIVSPKDQLRNNILNKEIIEEVIQLVIDEPALKQQQSVMQLLLWCIELSKARLLINEINRSEQWDNASTETKQGIQYIRDLYQKIDTSADREEKERLQKRIKKTMIDFQLSEKYFETLRFEPQKKQFLNQLDKHDCDFYAYFVRKDSSICIIHKGKDGFSFTKTASSDPLNRLILFKDRYFGNTPNHYNQNPLLYKTEAQYLTDQLLPNIKKSAASIYVSLDAQLYGFPFDALYNNGFLVKKHNFAYLNSYLLFDFLSDRSVSPTTISVLFRSAYPKPLPNLAFVDEEVKKISSKFKAEEIGPDKQTASIVRSQFTKANIIHIAAHTILDTAAAPVIYLKEAISTNQIRFYEMNVPLVFLSACNTGHGRPLPSEGTESIQRVFLSKNVPSVVSTFWFANDQAMLGLTASFYDNLSLTGDPMTALAQAKRIFLENADPVYENPWYWANINYTGIGNKIGLKKTSNLLYYLIGTVILFIVLFRYPVASRVYNMLKHKDKKTDNKTK